MTGCVLSLVALRAARRGQIIRAWRRRRHQAAGEAPAGGEAVTRRSQPVARSVGSAGDTASEPCGPLAEFQFHRVPLPTLPSACLLPASWLYVGGTSRWPHWAEQGGMQDIHTQTPSAPRTSVPHCQVGGGPAVAICNRARASAERSREMTEETEETEEMAHVDLLRHRNGDFFLLCHSGDQLSVTKPSINHKKEWRRRT